MFLTLYINSPITMKRSQIDRISIISFVIFLLSVSRVYGNNEDKLNAVLNDMHSGYLDQASEKCDQFFLHPKDSYEYKRGALLKAMIYREYGNIDEMLKMIKLVSPNDDDIVIRYYWNEAFSKFSYLSNQPQTGVQYLSHSLDLSKRIKGNDRVKFNTIFNELYLIYYTEDIERKLINSEGLPRRVWELFDDLSKMEEKMLAHEKFMYLYYKIEFAEFSKTSLRQQFIEDLIEYGKQHDFPVAKIIGNIYKVRSLNVTNIDDALTHLMKAEQLSKNIQTLRWIIEVKYSLMILYKENGDLDNAVFWGKKAAFPDNVDYSTYFDIYGQLSELYEQKGDLDSALYYKKVDYDKFKHVSNVHDDIMQAFFIKDLKESIDKKESEITKTYIYIILLGAASILVLFLWLRNKKFNKMLKSNNIELTANVEMIKNFSHILSHDLRAPIYSIKNLCGYTLSDEKDTLSEDSMENLELIRECCDNSIILISNVMSYIQTKGKNLKMENAQMKQIRMRLETNIDALIVTSGAKLHYENVPETIFGDEVLLIQLFQNLIQNSIKYRKEDIHPQIVISSRVSDTYDVMTVQDNGIGINSDKIDHLMEAFNQQSFSSSAEGVGLGLSICRHIMHLHKGEISIQSELGVGTAVSLCFPKNLFDRIEKEA